MHQVTLKKYAKLSPKTFIGPLGGKRIAVIRASGTITGAEAGGPTSSGINAAQVGNPILRVSGGNWSGKGRSMCLWMLRLSSLSAAVFSLPFHMFEARNFNCRLAGGDDSSLAVSDQSQLPRQACGSVK